MSLTTILSYSTKDYKGFRTFLSETFPKPRLKSGNPLLSPLLSTSPSLIGTAFDYLLRFHLQKKFKSKVVSNGWISENAINGYFKKPGIAYQSFGSDEEINAKTIKKLFAIKKKVPQKFKWCKAVHANFLQSKNNDLTHLLKACLFLARLDNIYRRSLPTSEELRTLFDIRKEV
jgi:hypothetical protein